MSESTTNTGKAVAKTSPGQIMKEKLDNTTVKVLEHLNALVDAKEIVFPHNYIPGNALKTAGLILLDLKDKDGKFALEVCKVSSIANALMAMCMDGLSVSKKQGYFIVYKDELKWQKSYMGNMLIAKRDAKVKEINANCIYDKDEFSYEVDVTNGRKKLISHRPQIEHQDVTKVKGAYAVVIFDDNTTDLEIMTIQQIKQAWLQGYGGGNTKAHQNFTDRMCRKTVINRACANLIGASDDGAILDEEDNDPQTATRDKSANEKRKSLDIQDTSFEEQPKDTQEINKDESFQNTKDGAVVEAGKGDLRSLKDGTLPIEKSPY